MPNLAELIQRGTTNAWLFVPTAILLGALHGLEPGHSKTMMAAFIVAVRGTVTQAVLLGLSATLSHTAVVWIVALGGMYFGQAWGSEANEPYFQLVSAAVIICIALWMVWRTWREQHAEHHDDHHRHDDEIRHVTTRDGLLCLEIFEEGTPPHWRVRSESGLLPTADHLTLETLRPDGARQSFSFKQCDDHLESQDEIPEPHTFAALLKLGEARCPEAHELQFAEHTHTHMNLGDEDDAHARAHAADIRARFEGRNVTTGQIVLFGLTGGLIPCPAAITVLLLCIQLKQFSLGFALVVCFGIGLALTMVSAGVLAAISVRQIEKRWSGFSAFARRAPYVSAALIVTVGLYTGWLGLEGIRQNEAHASGASASMPIAARSEA